MNTDTEQDFREDGRPVAAALREPVEQMLRNATTVAAKMVEAENTRYAKWADQQPDGRKPTRETATPWPGASDVRIRLADELVGEQVKLMKRITRSGAIAVKGTEGGDYANAGKVSIYLEYLRGTKLRRMVRKQTTLAAQYRQTHGHAIMALTWHQAWAQVEQPLTLAMVQQAAAEDQTGRIRGLLENLFDPEGRKEVVRWLSEQYALDKTRAWRIANELRTTGATTVPVRELAVNEPRWQALKPLRDVLYPLNTGDIQDAPWIVQRVRLTPLEVREKVFSEGWDADLAEKVVDTVGLDTAELAWGDTDGSRRQELWGDDAEDTRGLCEVWYQYYRHAEPDGLPGRYLTVYSPHCQEGVLTDQPLGLDHGLYPFVELRREDNDAALWDNRGVPELVLTQQAEIKSQRDARVNMTELAIEPPLIRPEREVGLRLTIRPRGEIGERRANAARFMNVPQYAPGSERLEEAVQKDVAGYFGRDTATQPVRANLFAQDLADDWGEELGEMWRHTLMLAQQFVSEAEFERTVGQTRQSIRLGRQEIQGAYDIQVSFNTAGLDNEHLIKRVEVLSKMLLPMNQVAGVIDLAPTLTMLFSQFFPELADYGLRSVDTATKAEVKDEETNWAQMLAGVEPEMAEGGQNFGLRLQRLEQILAKPENAQRAMQQADVWQIISRRLEHLRFMVQQQQNANTGRVGVEQA